QAIPPCLSLFQRENPAETSGSSRDCLRTVMNYTINEIFYSLQGEGANVGRPAVFCRFAGCNLWSGHEKDRPHAICTFCDTDFVRTDKPGGGKFADAAELAHRLTRYWPTEASPRARP